MMGVGVSLQPGLPSITTTLVLKMTIMQSMILIHSHFYIPNLLGLLREGCSQSQALQIINTIWAWSITLYNAPPSINIFFGFPTCQSKPVPTHFVQRHNVQSQSQRSLKSLVNNTNILHTYYMNTCHIWSPRRIIKSLPLSLSCYQ